MADLRIARGGLGSCGYNPPPPTTVNGAVTWPDGTTATSAPLILFPQGFSIDDGTPFWSLQADATGTYSFAGCPCADLVGWLLVPQNHSPDPFDGGRDCWILMQPEGWTIEGVAAGPGATVNWRMLDAPCADSPYNPSDADSMISALRAQQDSPDHLRDVGWAGTWQDARQRLGTL